MPPYRNRVIVQFLDFTLSSNFWTLCNNRTAAMPHGRHARQTDIHAMYKTIAALITVFTLAGCATGPDTRPDISIKGYTPGQHMAACPATSTQQRQQGETMYCVLPGETLGDTARVKAIQLAIHGGRLAMVTATVDRTLGVRTLDYVRSMYTAKYGDGITPYRDPFRHSWFIRRGVLTLDYADGTLTAYDRGIMRNVPTMDTSNL